MHFVWGLIMATVWGVITAVVVAIAARVAGVDVDIATLIGSACGLLVFAYQVIRRRI